MLIFGSYASGETRPDPDVDLLVIGRPDRYELTERLEAASRELGRPVNEVVMSSAELERRRARGDRFLESIDATPPIQVLP